MGASLLAKASCQSTMMLKVIPLSRAGSLPQGSSAFSVQRSADHQRIRTPRLPMIPFRSLSSTSLL
ncbi:hypothetical protein PspCFBP13508_02360 [Pseudomonas sp. CFBP13508]|nr:hypothetical protein PspCFBP13508_02360 [Pseudomonas sp. CFBP13508]